MNTPKRRTFTLSKALAWIAIAWLCYLAFNTLMLFALVALR